MKIKQLLLLLQSTFLIACGQNTELGLSKQDYSFGLKEAKNIKKEILKGEYEKAEKMIHSLSSANLSQTMDCLSLNIGEKTLEKWYEKSAQSEVSTLALGIFYGHKGWKIRGHGYAFDVKEKDALSFHDYQTKSEKLLNKITQQKKMIAEAQARLIRVHMSLGNLPKASSCFQNCIQLNANHLWAYIHQCESLQPKWGGDQQNINEFLNNLPKNTLIQQVVALKLTIDSFVAGENLFGDNEMDIKLRAQNTLKKIDQALEMNPLNSIHKYLIFGYMASISQELNDTQLLNKYYAKMHDYYALYPFGIME